MKKILSSLLAVGILATSVVAYANDTETIRGPYNTGNIELEIHMGFDPTTDGPTPPNPDMWISVEIPTIVLIFSNGEDNHETFAVVDHAIRNFSARGVRIDIDNFTATEGIAPITLLQINGREIEVDGAGNEIVNPSIHTHSLITSGTVPDQPATRVELMTLSYSTDGATNYTLGAFNFSGTINTAAFGTTAQADATLTLRLRPMTRPEEPEDGPSVPYDTVEPSPL